MVKDGVSKQDGAEELSAQAELKNMRLKSAMKTLKMVNANELEDLIIGAEQELSTRTPDTEVGWVHIKDYEEEIKDSIKTWGKVGGISTGLPSLDAVIGGLRKGQTFLIAGESNNGKSALAAQIAVNVSKRHKVGYISLEMLPGDNGARINHMNGGSEHDIKLDGMDIYFQSTTKLDYKKLEPLFKKAKEMGIEVMMLDYLQFLGRGMSQDEVGKMSQVIKQLALTYELPFIVIVSLRKGMARRWVDISIDDLMGTSAIGYDSDNTVVVSRQNLNCEYDEDHVYLKVLKLRNMRKTKDNEFLVFDWKDTRVSEPIVPLHLLRGEIPQGDIKEDGELTYPQDIQQIHTSRK